MPHLLFLWCVATLDVTVPPPCTRERAIRVEDAGELLPGEDCSAAIERWALLGRQYSALDRQVLFVTCEPRR